MTAFTEALLSHTNDPAIHYGDIHVKYSVLKYDTASLCAYFYTRAKPNRLALRTTKVLSFRQKLHNDDINNFYLKELVSQRKLEAESILMGEGDVMCLYQYLP